MLNPLDSGSLRGVSVVLTAVDSLDPLMASPLMVCFLPVFLYVPVTVHPVEVIREIVTPFIHFDFFGTQLGITWSDQNTKKQRKKTTRNPPRPISKSKVRRDDLRDGSAGL